MTHQNVGKKNGALKEGVSKKTTEEKEKDISTRPRLKEGWVALGEKKWLRPATEREEGGGQFLSKKGERKYSQRKKKEAVQTEREGGQRSADKDR